MIILQGTLRQRAEMTFTANDQTKPVTRLKLWVEHTSPRDNGPPDLKLEELFLDLAESAKLPPDGAQVSVSVRPYPSGRSVAFSALGVIDAKGAKN